MPDLDGGHYFLTALLPIDNRGIVEHEGFKSSPVHMVREALETLPTALQSQAAEEIGVQSPFARSLRTHLCRFVVIDQPFFNGRDPSDAVVGTFTLPNLLEGDPPDALNCPYLLFSSDFDPMGDEPRAYLEDLWRQSSEELTTVFQYCWGFEAVSDPASFADLVIACQVETTMPFNDYWTSPPALPSLEDWQLLVAPGVAAAAAIIGGLLLGAGVWTILVLALIAFAGGVWISYALVMHLGAKLFPTAPDSDLRNVLKALYLQQAFSRFALAHQGAEPKALRAAFADFVARHRPADLDGPTQPPGVIRTAFPAQAPSKEPVDG
jgi:hypothetical protein